MAILVEDKEHRICLSIRDVAKKYFDCDELKIVGKALTDVPIAGYLTKNVELNGIDLGDQRVGDYEGLFQKTIFREIDL